MGLVLFTGHHLHCTLMKQAAKTRAKPCNQRSAELHPHLALPVQQKQPGVGRAQNEEGLQFPWLPWEPDCSL